MLSNTGGVSGAELAVPPLSRLRTSAAASKCRSPISAQVLLARPPRSFSHRTHLNFAHSFPPLKIRTLRWGHGARIPCAGAERAGVCRAVATCQRGDHGFGSPWLRRCLGALCCARARQPFEAFLRFLGRLWRAWSEIARGGRRRRGGA